MSRSFLILLCHIILVLNFLNFTACKSSYSITAPGSIRSNRKYTVCATLHNVEQPANLIIGLRHNSTWSDQQSVWLQPMESKLVDFFPPKLDLTKEYELYVEGVQGLYFYDSTPLLVGQNEGVNIYIETDRGTYKPGDLVHFRIVILDEQAKPVKIKEPIKVLILDNLGNRVKQFKDISLSKGVYVNEIQLSKEPILGTWSIKVYIAGRYAQEKSAKFQVDKYVLPKFFVIIEAEDNFVIENRFMKIVVSGRYTYNKQVEGKVQLRIKEKVHGFTADLASFAADTVDFKAIFNIDMDELKEITTSNRLVVSASLFERQTGVMQSATTVINLQHEAHKITMLDDEVEVQNGKPFRIKVKIQYWNNTAVNDPGASVFMEKDKKISEAKLNDNDVAVFEDEFTEFASVIVSYKNSSNWLYIPSISGVHTKDSNCDMKIKTKSSDMNSTIDILVEFIRDIPYLVYVLTSHGNIIKNEFVHMDEKQKSYTIRLRPSNEMVPVSFLYVHYIYAGFLTFCELRIDLPEKLENELSLSAPKNVRPGENITIKLNAQPDSRIAITAVDLSSMLLNAGNRINKSDVLNEMRSDRSYTRADKKYVINPGILSGLVTLTDIPYSVMRSLSVQSIPGELSPLENYVRSYFPETWIFLDLNVTTDLTTINFTLPDTITTWVLSTFSVNEKTGIGLLDADVQITSSKPFFISTYLPYSIKRGEIVSILLVVFNYHSNCLPTEVVMENPLNEFQFVDDISNVTTNSPIEKRNIIVPANSGKSVNFLIKAQKLGHIDIIVEATSELSRDKVLQKLLVEPDGLATSHNHELFINMKPRECYTTSYRANIPEKIEPDTEFLQLSISGDVLLPSLDNLENLVDMPTGCGEQNMINFVPNILVLEYLRVTDQSSLYKGLVAKAQKFTEIGYQQQLKFRHTNGGYSVFGPEQSKNPSNWLTAYVVRFFIKATKYLAIESKIIDSGLKFLADSQLSSGEFTNSGYQFNAAYQGSKSFTAYVLLSFLENAKYARKYKNVIQKALDFLANDIDQVGNVYSLAIIASVFQIARHEQASHILDKLKPLAQTKNDLQWWHDITDDGSTDVEITSYVLLALLHTPGHYLPIAKWLIEQRNSNGGFRSTQDTIVGLQALIKFAQLTSSQNATSIKVFYKASDAENVEVENGIVSLDSENLKVLQHNQLPPSTRLLDIEVSGTGSIFLQFSYKYRKFINDLPMRKNKKSKSFIVKKNAELTANGLKMNLEICIQYKPQDDSKHLKTNMIIAEVALPSGYNANDDNIKELRDNENVDRLENDTPGKVIFYFTYIEANEEKCVDLVADNKHNVRNLKPSMIVVYEYYHSKRREVVTYEIENKIKF